MHACMREAVLRTVRVWGRTGGNGQKITQSACSHVHGLRSRARTVGRGRAENTMIYVSRILRITR